MDKKIFYKMIILILLFKFGVVYAQHSGRDEWQQPERIMDSLGVQEGMTIGEPGAGDGYFTFKLAKRVGPAGKIYANDIDEDKLKTLQRHAAHEKISNIKTIIGEVEDPLLPDSTMDLIVMVYVFHDLEEPENFLRNIRKDLKKGAKLFLVERDPERFGERHKHFLPRDEVTRLVFSGGFRVTKIIDDFPRDNIYVCKPDSSD